MEPRPITIDSRQFHGVTNEELSAAQDDYIVGQLRLAGAIEAFFAAAENPDDANAEALLTQLMVSGRSSQLLAGCLTEVGKRWTIEEAQRNAERFATTTKPEDKTAMRTAIVGFVLCFFQYALQFALTSRKSSVAN